MSLLKTQVMATAPASVIAIILGRGAGKRAMALMTVRMGVLLDPEMGNTGMENGSDSLPGTPRTASNVGMGGLNRLIEGRWIQLRGIGTRSIETVTDTGDRQGILHLPARRERSRSFESGERDSIERNQIAREESVERRFSKKRKEDGGNDEDTTEKRTRPLDGTNKEEREVEKERRRFGDRANEDTGSLNGDDEERRRDGRQPKDQIEEVGDAGGRRKEPNFKDRVKGEQLGYGEDRREERRPSDVIKEEKMSDGEEGRASAREERRGKEIPKDSKSMDELEEGISKDRVKEEFGYREESKPQVSGTRIEKFATKESDFEGASQNTERMIQMTTPPDLWSNGHIASVPVKDALIAVMGRDGPTRALCAGRTEMLGSQYDRGNGSSSSSDYVTLMQQLQEQNKQMEEMCVERRRDRQEIENMHEQMEKMLVERSRDRQEIKNIRGQMAQMQALMSQLTSQTSQASTSDHERTDESGDNFMSTSDHERTEESGDNFITDDEM